MNTDTDLYTDEITDTAVTATTSPCGDPDCTNGVVDGGEYLSHAGDIGNIFYDCPVCRPGVVDEIPGIDEAMEYIGF